jgi:transposase
MDAIGILPAFRGIAVHGCWSSYWKYPDVQHALWYAYLLRELNGIIENHPEQTWALQFKELLLAMKKVRDKALSKGKDEISYYHLHKFDKQTR